MEETITQYISVFSRNKIIIHSDEFDFLKTIDLGQTLSECIYNFDGIEKLPNRVLQEIDDMFSDSVAVHESYGEYLSIKNVGILFEPALKLNVYQLFEKYSLNNALFVEWQGDIVDSHLYFLSKERGIKTNIKNLSHIIL